MEHLKKMIKEYEEKLRDSREEVRKMNQDREENGGGYPDISYTLSYEVEESIQCFLINLLKDLRQLEQQQLVKEDLEKMIRLKGESKDNLKYDKLPSKNDKNMYLVIKDSDNIKDHYKITDLISKNTDHEEKENFWYWFGLEQYWIEYCWSSGTIEDWKNIDEYLAKKFKELQEKSWNEIIEKYVKDKFGYSVVNHLSDINWEKQLDKNIEPVR